jgi:beta-lactamase regulating signal transducer with metallopeptidase domain
MAFYFSIMKTALIVTLLCAFALPSFAELTKRDVEQIIEPIKLDIAEMKGKMATKEDIIAVRDEISGLYRWVIIMWITIILAIFGIPYLYGRTDRRKVQELEVRLREEERRVERMQAEFDTLKSLREAATRLVQENPEFAEGFRRLGII